MIIFDINNYIFTSDKVISDIMNVIITSKKAILDTWNIINFRNTFSDIKNYIFY